MSSIIPEMPKDPFEVATAQYREAGRELARLSEQEDFDNPRFAPLVNVQRIIAERVLPLISAMIESRQVIIHAGSVDEVERSAVQQKARHGHNFQYYTEVDSGCMNGSAIQINLNLFDGS